MEIPSNIIPISTRSHARHPYRAMVHPFPPRVASPVFFFHGFCEFLVVPTDLKILLFASVRVMPHDQDTGGFFVAVLDKAAGTCEQEYS